MRQDWIATDRADCDARAQAHHAPRLTRRRLLHAANPSMSQMRTPPSDQGAWPAWIAAANGLGTRWVRLLLWKEEATLSLLAVIAAAQPILCAEEGKAAPAADTLDLRLTIAVEPMPFASMIDLIEQRLPRTPAVIGSKLLIITADPAVWHDRLVRLSVASAPLHDVLDQICRQADVRWRRVGDQCVFDRPLAPGALAALGKELSAIPAAPDAAALDALDHAARALARCGDGDALPLLVAALGNPAFDQRPPAAAATAYQRTILEVLGDLYGKIDREYVTSGQAFLGLAAGAPPGKAAIAHAWSRAVAHDLPFSPTLCCLAGSAGLVEAVPQLRTLVTAPERLATDLDPKRHAQAIALRSLRTCAIWSLGILGDRASVATLRGIVRDAPKECVGRMAAIALMRLGVSEAAPDLVAWSPTSDRDQCWRYIALATLAPEQLAAALPPHRPLPWGTKKWSPVPNGWWQGMLMLPVPQIAPVALSMAELSSDQGWRPHYALVIMARQLPRAYLEPVVRARLAAAPGPHMRTCCCGRCPRSWAMSRRATHLLADSFAHPPDRQDKYAFQDPDL